MDITLPASTPVPVTSDWVKVHSLLHAAWKALSDESIPKPPTPLILAGAPFSTPSEIRSRWVALIVWANENGFSALLGTNLPPSPDHDVAKSIAGLTEDAKGWWPEYSYSQHEPKPTHGQKIVDEKFNYIKDNWREIVGENLANCTVPFKFTGRKSRRLVVLAKPEIIPPWGSWNALLRERHTFAAFRKAINEAISPMEVDVVDFEMKEKVNKPAPRQNSEAKQKVLTILQEQWPEIVGNDLADCSRPYKFAGRNFRKLIVKVNTESKPSWGGGWYPRWLMGGASLPRKYKEFIESINLAITPMKIDEVDFTKTAEETET